MEIMERDEKTLNRGFRTEERGFGKDGGALVYGLDEFWTSDTEGDRKGTLRGERLDE